MHSVFKKILIAILGLFALIGVLFTGVFIAMQFGLLNVRGASTERNAFFASANANTVGSDPCSDTDRSACTWNETPEWAVVAGGLEKDAAIINRVAEETGVSPRLIVAMVIPEQIRFFTSNREVFKRYFEPLKILGSLSQFSLGVSGIKQETAAAIEQHANDPTSPFYPGPGIAELIAYEDTSDHGNELYRRLTDADDHYYSYLYTAIYVKEILAQWKRAGYDLTDKPEIVATLFNIGFERSIPKADPVAAGAPIVTGGETYPFGVLGGLFHRSNELRNLFGS